VGLNNDGGDDLGLGSALTSPVKQVDYLRLWWLACGFRRQRNLVVRILLYEVGALTNPWERRLDH